MTTTKKRLNRLTLTISDELKAALAELNDATGVAAASFVAEIIEGNIPMIRGIAEAARKAKEEPGRALEMMQRAMLEALHDISETQMELMDEQSKLRTYHRKDDDQ
jgi:predicted DNA-binding protein